MKAIQEVTNSFVNKLILCLKMEKNQIKVLMKVIQEVTNSFVNKLILWLKMDENTD